MSNYLAAATADPHESLNTNSRKLAELRERRGATRKKIDAIFKRLDTEKRATLTDAEQDELAVLGTEATRIGAELDDLIAAVTEGRTALFGHDRQDRATSAPGKRWADLHGRENVTGTGGFNRMAEFFQAVLNGRHDPRLERASSGAVDSEGGFLIPPAWSASLLDGSLESEIVRSRAKVVPMTSRQQRFPMWDDLTHTSDTLYGGFTAAWVAEDGAGTVQTPRLREINLSANKLMILARASNELLDDATTFERDLQGAMTNAVGWFLDRAFLQGDGVGKPLGALNSPSLVTVAKESGQLAATIQVENIVNMWSRLAPASQPNSVWVANPAIVPQLFTVGLSVGTGGAPLYIPIGGIPQAPAGSLLGRPILFTEKVPTLGTVGDLILADFSQYVIGIRREVTVDLSRHAGFTSDQTYFRITVRLDGQSSWSSALTPANGNSLSWCVALATRS